MAGAAVGTGWAPVSSCVCRCLGGSRTWIGHMAAGSVHAVNVAAAVSRVASGEDTAV